MKPGPARPVDLPALTLTLNTAEKRVQFALIRGDALLCAQDWLAQSGGTELLTPALQNALERLGLAPRAIRRVACVAGPGGFTGLRLAVTTAAGLARACGAAQAGLDYMQCLAASVPAQPGQRLHVAVNARRGWAYSGLYLIDANGFPQRQGDITLLPLPQDEENTNLPETTGAGAALLRLAGPAPDYVLGSAVSGHDHFFAGLYPAETHILPPSCDHPTPAGLYAVTRAIDWNAPEYAAGRDVAPWYIRDCDAVDNLDAIATAMGRDPQKAHEELQRLTRCAAGNSCA